MSDEQQSYPPAGETAPPASEARETGETRATGEPGERATSPEHAALIAQKIMPRNQTAVWAKHVPRGNPPGTRPDSGPDNCFPGYDFDQRNIESAFFPGLRFSFHLGDDGVLVTDVLPHGPAADQKITRTNLPLFLWGLMGRTQSGQEKLDDVPIYSFKDLDALAVWARVRDLLPGPIAILLGRQPPRIPGVPGEAEDKLREAFRTNTSHVERVKGAVQWIVLVGDRSPYLDEKGVLDPAGYEPGELTRSLCAPWQFDFKDCHCFFWAAIKPDVVTSVDGDQPFAYYVRSQREGTPPPDILNEQGSRQPALGYAPLIGGAWNDLPVVLNDREVVAAVAPPAQPQPPVMTREEFITELRYLATVEHALAVQYLYAHYSLNAPLLLHVEPPPGKAQVAIFAAAREIFSIAVDEMRHLRWVNEALTLLGIVPELGRARRIGRTLDHPFELVPLTPAQLQWFIDVEEPSRHDDREDEDGNADTDSSDPSACASPAGKEKPQNVDGMYVRLLTNVKHISGDAHVVARLEQLIKLIIDEGNDHYERFLSVRAHLGSLTPNEYLRLERVECNPKRPRRDLAQLLRESDARYRDVLFTLLEAFKTGDRAGGAFLEQSRRTMQNMHEINHLLASQGIGPRFTLPRALRYERDIEPAGNVAIRVRSRRLSRGKGQGLSQGVNDTQGANETQGKLIR